MGNQAILAVRKQEGIFSPTSSGRGTELLFGRLPETPISCLRRAIEEPETELPREVELYLKQLQDAAGTTGCWRYRPAGQKKTASPTRTRKGKQWSLHCHQETMFSVCQQDGQVHIQEIGQPYLPTRCWEGQERGIGTHSSCISPDCEAVDGLTLGPQAEEKDTAERDWTKTKGLDSLPPDRQKKLTDLLKKYQDVFKDVPDIADFKPYSLNTGDCKPISQHPYRPGLMWKARIQEEVKELLDSGIIRPSTSPWSSPVMPVPKPDGSVRICRLSSC